MRVNPDKIRPQGTQGPTTTDPVTNKQAAPTPDAPAGAKPSGTQDAVSGFVSAGGAKPLVASSGPTAPGVSRPSGFIGATALPSVVGALPNIIRSQTPVTFGSEGVTSSRTPGMNSTVDRLKFLNGVERSPDTEPKFFQTELLAEQLQAHKNDPAWIQSLYQSMGSNLSAKMIADAGSPLSYMDATRSWNKLPVNEIRGRIETVQNSLITLHQSGALNQGDMDKLAEQWAKGNNDPKRLVEIFGKMPPGGEALQEMFVNSALRATRGKEGESATNLAGAAATVLSKQPDDKVVAKLGELRKSGELKDFMGKAMRADMQFASPTLHSKESRSGIDPNPPPDTTVSNGAVSLLTTLSYANIRDGRQGPGPLSSADLTAVRTEVFGEAVKAFGEKRGAYEPAVKDAMSRIYRDDFDSINTAIMGKNRAVYSETAVGKGMAEFYQHALFTPPIGFESRALMDHLTSKIEDLSKSLSVDAFGDNDSAKKQQTLNAHKLGLLQGTMMNGLQQAQDDIKKSSEAWGNAIDFVLKSGLSAIPGAGKLVGELGSELLGGLFDKIGDAAKEQIRSMTVDEAKKYLQEKGEGRMKFAGLAQALRAQVAGNVMQYGEWGQAYDDALKIK